MDMTCGRGVQCLLLMESGQMMGCAVKSRTMLARLNAAETNDTENQDDGKEVE